METAIIIIFILGYLGIAFEHSLKIDKLVPALVMMALIWAIISFFGLTVYDIDPATKSLVPNKLEKVINVIKKRTNLVKKVLALKNKKSQIVDQKRIRSILKNIKKKSLKNNIDPKITSRIWKNMIFAYIDFERRNFKKK